MSRWPTFANDISDLIAGGLIAPPLSLSSTSENILLAWKPLNGTTCVPKDPEHSRHYFDLLGS
jgi:hypothetical protein